MVFLERRSLGSKVIKQDMIIPDSVLLSLSMTSSGKYNIYSIHAS